MPPTRSNAHAKVEEELNVGQRVFARLLDAECRQARDRRRACWPPTSPFREAIATHDIGTLASVLTNHGARIGADAMLFVDLDGSGRRRHAAAGGRDAARSNTRRCSSDRTAPRTPAWKCSTAAPSSWSPCRCWRRCRSAGWSWASRSTTTLARDLRRLTELEVSFCRCDDAATAGACSPRRSMRRPGSKLLRGHAAVVAADRDAHGSSIAGVDHQALVIPLGATTTRASSPCCIARWPARSPRSTACATRCSCWRR